MKQTKFYQSILLSIKASGIKRNTGYQTGHKENDAEHSFQLAIVSWSTNKQYKLDLNDEKILKYALVHDLVEVFAGDTDAYAEKKLINSKQKREQLALMKMKKKYNHLTEITDTIEQYELKQDPESQLVYILDKFIPDFHIFLSDDNYYHERKVDVEEWKQWLNSKLEKISLHPSLEPIVEDITNYELKKFQKIFYSNL